MTAKSNKFYIPSLDGIRAVAVVVVCLSHAGVKQVPGGFGVTVFFFLSGYLITTLLRRERDRSDRIDFKKFYMRRVLRILPPFYLVLLFALVISYLMGVYADPKPLQWDAFLSQFFHFSNYHNVQYGNAYMALGTEVYWSLAVEEHFYLLFPLLYACLRRFDLGTSKQLTVFWGLCLLVLLWRCLLVYGMGAGYDRIFYATDTRLDSILFGCALAIAGNPAVEEDRQLSEGMLKYVLLPLGFLALLFSFALREETFRNTFRYTFQGVALYPIFIAAIRFPCWGVFRILNLDWVRFVGVLSYSMYLIHFVVIKALKGCFFPESLQPGYVDPHTFNSIAIGVLSLPISLALSYGIYRLAEVPAAKLKRRFAA